MPETSPHDIVADGKGGLELVKGGVGGLADMGGEFAGFNLRQPPQLALEASESVLAAAR